MGAEGAEGCVTFRGGRGEGGEGEERGRESRGEGENHSVCQH